MTTLLASSIATSATATEGDVKTYLANLRSYISDLLGTDSTDKTAVLALLGSVLNGKTSKTGSYTVVAGDRGKVIECTGTFTITVTAAATLGDGFVFAVRNAGSGTISLDPNLSEQISGKTAESLIPGDFVIVYCDGSAFYTVGKKPDPINSMVRLHTANGYGSTNIVVRRFLTQVTNVGSDITYSDSVANGATFTINTSGVYAISYSDNFDRAAYYGISLNSTQLTAAFSTINAADKLIFGTTAATNYTDAVSWTGYLAAGSVIRAHTDGYAAYTNTSHFTISRVA